MIDHPTPEPSEPTELSPEQRAAGERFRKTINRIFYRAKRVEVDAWYLSTSFGVDDHSYAFMRSTTDEINYPRATFTRDVLVEGKMYLQNFDLYGDGSVRLWNLDTEKTGLDDALRTGRDMSEVFKWAMEADRNTNLEMKMGVHESEALPAEEIDEVVAELRLAAGITT